MIARMLYGADPFRDMRRLHNEMNQMAGRGTVGAPEFPAFNAYANQDGVVLTAELPGVKSEDLDISVHRDAVTISGQRQGAEEAEGITGASAAGPVCADAVLGLHGRPGPG